MLMLVNEGFTNEILSFFLLTELSVVTTGLNGVGVAEDLSYHTNGISSHGNGHVNGNVNNVNGNVHVNGTNGVIKRKKGRKPKNLENCNGNANHCSLTTTKRKSREGKSKST